MVSVMIFLLILFFLCISSAGEVYAQSVTNAEEPSKLNWYIDGYVDARYTLESGEDRNDQELTEYISLSFGETKERIISGHISGFLKQDLDSANHSAPLASFYDTYGQNYARLGTAYLDFRPGFQFLEHVRVGRQWIYDVPQLSRMDGVRIETENLDSHLRTRAILFGGIPDNTGESSRSNDRVFGGGLKFHPFKSSSFSAFYTRVQEEYEREYVDNSADDNSDKFTFKDDLLRFEFRKLFFENRFSLFTGYTNLNGKSRDLKLRLRVIQNPDEAAQGPITRCSFQLNMKSLPCSTVLSQS